MVPSSLSYPSSPVLLISFSVNSRTETSGRGHGFLKKKFNIYNQWNKGCYRFVQLIFIYACLVNGLLSVFQDKCGSRVNEVWPYMVQELGPTLDELGIPTPEQLGYDKPELAVQDVYELH